jgi:hypothetical protein
LDPELASAVGTRARPGREERAERQGGSFLSSPQAAQACFELMGNVCAIRVHTKEAYPNEKALQILFMIRLLHPKAIAEKAVEHFFLLASSLIFEM